jgi:hypothetical protein
MKGPIDFPEVNAAALSAIHIILRRWLPGGQERGCEYVVKNPTRTDHSPGSFSINTVTGKWADFATGDRGGDPVSLAAYLFGLSQIEAARRIAEMLGIRGT